MTPGPLTPSDLKRGFEALGLGSGDVVMLHSSFKALGPVADGPLSVARSLMDVVGEEGGILVFGSWKHSTYDVFVKGPGLSDQERHDWPAFEGSASPVRPNYAGAIGTAIAALPNAGRSANPDRSLIALGNGALSLIETHGLDHGFGPATPLARFVERDGKTVLLGAPFSTVTIVHLAEYLARLDGKRSVHYEVPLLEAGRKVWYPVEQMDRDVFVAAAKDSGHDHIAAAAQAFVEARGLSAQLIGAACSYLFDARDFVDHSTAWLERRFA